ncbi:SPOR domain-containing protein [Rickettsia sp. TH2014]|uniref:SPOR domain-containing protein n=1 Tax=Rickettsia sp. TH2014 TaxID=1967503 RepID=UPI001C46313E|nr:SPOR domain-containing protein [Rickettsia sp. TH2014]
MINNIFVKICLVCLICISAIYFGYQYYQNSKPVITIYPDELPTKIKPSIIENNKIAAVHSSIYENLIAKDTNIKTVKLLPDPEKPMNIDSHNQSQGDESFDEISNLIALIEPSDNSKNETDLNIIKLEKGSKDKVSNAKNCKNNESYKIQLGSVKSGAEAMQEGERIKKKFPKILKNVVITTKKVKYDDGKFFYLILAGDYGSLSQAKAVCKKLAYNKQSCVLK